MSSSVPRILIVEDDPGMAELVGDLVQSEGWEPVYACDSGQALAALKAGTIDIALIDHNLPGLSGRALAQKIRDSEINSAAIGIIMVTAAGSAAERVLGLETAADDYVVKPFEPVELAARIRALMRRLRPNSKPVEASVPAAAIEIGHWVVDIVRRKAWSRVDAGLALTASEFSLIEILLRQPGVPVSRGDLMSGLAMDDSRYVDRNVDVLVLRLRRKMEQDPARPQYIRTMRGRGYVLTLPARAR